MMKEQRRKEKRQGSQLDVMKSIRKNMPPSTKVMRPKNKNNNKSKNNWRDYLEEEGL